MSIKKTVFIILSVLFAFALLLCGCTTNTSEGQSDENTEANTDNNASVTLEDDIKQNNLASTEYEINGLIFSVPSTWSKVDNVSNSSDNIIFQIDDNENNRVVITYEAIPDIMKIDAGNGALLTKEDVAEYYSHPDLFQISDAQWKNDYEFDYYDTYFTTNLKLNDGTSDTRSGRNIILPINENESVITIMITSEVASDLDYGDVILSNLTLMQ